MNVASPEPAQSYLQLRERILNLDPADLGFKPAGDKPGVWGVLMETGYEVGTASLVALADGTTSLYYSTGGGMLGSGGYSPVAQASKALVAEAEHHTDQLLASEDFPLPAAGQVRFYFMTYNGFLQAETTEKDLASGNHVLSPLYQLAQETLTQLRLLAEKKRK
ncbi:MAG TPA: hypothetical protein VF831_11070 [Anaerolineales bacterium]